MIRNVKWVFVVLVISSIISLSFDRERVPADRLAIGDMAPELVINGERHSLSVPDTVGRFTLLSFWASHDAASRAKNAAFGHLTKCDDRVKMVSVSFDRYASVFRATVEQDSLAEADCHMETGGTDSDAFKAYHLEHGFTTCLLDKDGRILALNLEPEELASYLD